LSTLDVVAQFTYDGESAAKGYGNRVKSVESGVTTLFVGGHYQMTDATVTKYYFAGSQRIAIRKYAIPQSMKVEYLLTIVAQGFVISTSDSEEKSALCWKDFSLALEMTCQNRFAEQYLLSDHPSLCSGQA